MGSQSPRAMTNEPRVESGSSCGCIAYILGVGSIVLALIVLGTLLLTGNPDRWQGIANPTLHPLALVIDQRSPRTVYLATEQGQILISHDGGQTWSEHHEGLPRATPISSLALMPGTPANDHVLAGTSAGVYLSSDGGATWRSAGAGIPPHTIVDAVAALPDGTLLAGTSSDGVYVSRSGGATWMPASGLPQQSDVYVFMSMPSAGRVLAGLISGGIFVSQDNGMTWTESDQGLGVASGANVFSFVVIPAVAGQNGAMQTILAGTSRGIYVSRSHGATWRPSSAGIGTTRVISLARDPLSSSDVFAGTDTGVFASVDGGTTWRTRGFGFPTEQHVGVVSVIHPMGGDRVVLASVDRLYRYPGQWFLASQPWRAVGASSEALLAVALAALIVWQIRALRGGVAT